MTTETDCAVQSRGEESQMRTDAKGAALDAPFTRPFEGFSYLKKDWVDHEDGIEAVVLHTTISGLNLPANWNLVESFVMMPEWGSLPLRRSWVVRLPTHFNGEEKYLFHHYFQVRYEDGSEKFSDTFTQLIMPKNVEYIDHSGTCTHIIMHWSIDGWSYPQDTELEVAGIEWGEEFSVSQVPYRSGDRLYERGRLYSLQRLPAPRRFHATVWAPRGAVLHYCFVLVNTDADGNLYRRWDNNCGNNFKLTI